LDFGLLEFNILKPKPQTTILKKMTNAFSLFHPADATSDKPEAMNPRVIAVVNVQ